MNLRAKLHRYRWAVALGLLCVIVAAYLLVPQLIWLRRALARINAATVVASANIDKPAADWQTTDLAGVRHSLADYRGKVVVLDFWYSGCGWCIRGMPQMVELADEFAGQNVAVLGVNSDEGAEKVADALRLIEHFKFPFATLKSANEGKSLDETYRVTMWPTAIVLDQQGVVRHVHCGYWPTMRRSLAAKIRELLATAE